ncbi:MAG: hypothetical protein HQL36_01465 [Alphaproteobacteria bacterium]|nr:hypothetical protein [Alphaproteobacteria bacterium]
MFGITFLIVFSVLVVTVLLCWSRQTALLDSSRIRLVWFEGGMQAAGGIATLALTFTLFGISLGIGTLADQSLSPETVPTIISELTRHFSMAFMTTVVGLPVSAALRALLIVTERKMEAQS